jgi:glycerol-3-phosphate cytidylyltransferase
VKVLTIGSFDVPHIGHAILFKRCEEFGELTVGINSDELIEGYKGRLPLYSFKDRALLVSKMGYEVARNNSAGRDLINMMRPDILVVGSNWAKRDYLKHIDVSQDYLDENEITLIYVPYTQGISSTDIKRRSVESNNTSNL